MSRHFSARSAKRKTPSMFAPIKESAFYIVSEPQTPDPQKKSFFLDVFTIKVLNAHEIKDDKVLMLRIAVNENPQIDEEMRVDVEKKCPGSYQLDHLTSSERFKTVTAFLQSTGAEFMSGPNIHVTQGKKHSTLGLKLRLEEGDYQLKNKAFLGGLFNNTILTHLAEKKVEDKDRLYSITFSIYQKKFEELLEFLLSHKSEKSYLIEFLCRINDCIHIHDASVRFIASAVAEPTSLARHS